MKTYLVFGAKAGESEVEFLGLVSAKKKELDSDSFWEKINQRFPGYTCFSLAKAEIKASHFVASGDTIINSL